MKQLEPGKISYVVNKSTIGLVPSRLSGNVLAPAWLLEA